MTKPGRNGPCHCGSGLKYKRCHIDWDSRPGDAPTRAGSNMAGSVGGYGVYLLGERPNAFVQQTWSTPTGPITTANPLDVFDARLAPFSLDSIVSLVGSLTRRYFKDQRKFRDELTRAGLESHTTFSPFLLRRLTTQVISRRPLPDTATGTIEPKWLAAAERVLFDALNGRGAPGDSQSMAMRLLQDQYHDQSDYDTFIRELWLNLETIRLCEARGVDVESAYQAYLGLTYSELAFLSFAAYATVLGDGSTGALDPNTWFSTVRDRIHLRDGALTSFFARCSMTVDQFSEEARKPHLSEPGFESYSFSPLVYSPLLRRTNGTLVAPVARDLLERSTRSFAIDVLRAVSSSTGMISDLSGRAYESYVGESLRAVLPSSTRDGSAVFPIDKMNCDFVCSEDEGVVLVEAKSARLRLRADVSKDRAILKEELTEKGVGHGLAQLNTSALQVSAGKTSRPTGTKLVALLVVRGDLVLLNWPLIRELLEEIAIEETGTPVTVPYQVVNDEAFSDLVRLKVEGASIFTTLFEKATGAPYNRGADIHTLLTSSRKKALPPHPLRAIQFEAFSKLLGRFGIAENDLPSPGTSPLGQPSTS